MDDPKQVRELQRPHGLPFHIGKLGHVVLNVRDVERSARFYTQVLGFQVSNVYPEGEVEGRTKPGGGDREPVRGQDTTLQDPG
jgi:catechol 2,3-dioxygenase-like lactoylglutathione lyase family enzyme